MKKDFFLGAVTGACLCFAGLLVFAQGWSHRDGPQTKHFLALSTSVPSAQATCEVLPALGLARRILLGSPRADGRIEGCVLQIHGSFNDKGDFVPAPRPDNFLDVTAWKADLSLLTIQADRIHSSCTVSQFLGAQGGTKVEDKVCLDFLEYKNALQSPGARQGTDAAAR